jgi:hypothetical protein
LRATDRKAISKLRIQTIGIKNNDND